MMLLPHFKKLSHLDAYNPRNTNQCIFRILSLCHGLVSLEIYCFYDDDFHPAPTDEEEFLSQQLMDQVMTSSQAPNTESANLYCHYLPAVKILNTCKSEDPI